MALLPFEKGYFGQQLHELRCQRGWTLEMVAKKLRTHKGYISGIENNKVNPPASGMVRKIALLFGQDALWMVVLARVEKTRDEEARKFLAKAASDYHSYLEGQKAREKMEREKMEREKMERERMGIGVVSD